MGDDNTIFIQIASYRDPELIPTIKDCMQKSKMPELLSFGICWQHASEDTWDDLSEFKMDKRFTIHDVDWSESKGLGWARSITQSLYKGEKYTLQLDSHHRFIEGWDQELINMMKQTNSDKPILTTYGAPYTPGEPLVDHGPNHMLGTNFTNYGTILFYPSLIPNHLILSAPIPARFVSGHFFFTLGIHCIEYKYDPEIYFAGDEISLSIRSFTLGYDIFHPHKTIVWHEYTREGRKKHWDDFVVRDEKKPLLWHELDSNSKKKLRHLLQEEDNHIDLGEFCLGKVRSHKDYEKYAGINFKLKLLHPDTVSGKIPPVNCPDDFKWETLNTKYNYKLNIPFIEMQDVQFICVSVDTVDNVSLFRNDLTTYVETINVNIKTHLIPHHWTFWPYYKTSGWGDKQEFSL
jgi:hypothetical protein